MTSIEQLDFPYDARPHEETISVLGQHVDSFVIKKVRMSNQVDPMANCLFDGRAGSGEHVAFRSRLKMGVEPELAQRGTKV